MKTTCCESFRGRIVVGLLIMMQLVMMYLAWDYIAENRAREEDFIRFTQLADYVDAQRKRDPPLGNGTGKFNPTVNIFTFINHFPSDPINDKKTDFCALAYTAMRETGLPVHVLGFQDSRVFFDGVPCDSIPSCARCSSGFMYKFEWMKYLLKNRDKTNLADDDVIYFVDGFDSLFVKPLSNLTTEMEYRLQHERGIIWNAEQLCWPMNRKRKKQLFRDKLFGEGYRFRVQSTRNGPISMIDGLKVCERIIEKTTQAQSRDHPYAPHLNSGQYVGDVVSLDHFFSSVPVLEEYGNYDDQAITQLSYIMYPQLNMKIDSDAEMFVISNLATFDDHSRPHLVDESRGNPERSPYSLHFPGFGFQTMHAFRKIYGANVEIPSDMYFIDYDRNKTVPLRRFCGDRLKN